MRSKKPIYKFQVIYMLNPELSINKAFKEKAEINMANYFGGEPIMPVRKVLKRGTLVFFNF